MTVKEHLATKRPVEALENKHCFYNTPNGQVSALISDVSKCKGKSPSLGLKLQTDNYKEVVVVDKTEFAEISF